MALSEREILAAIDAKAEIAYGADGTLENERGQALDYYLGRPYGNEIEGRSQVVTSDVLETIEWILPSLMRIFTGGDKVVEFEPQGLEDEPAAKQETDVLNQVILNQNDAFITFLTWFKDALLSKTAYVKVYYDTSEDVTQETYDALSEVEVGMVAQDPSVEIVSIDQVIDALGQPAFTVRLKRTNKVGKVCIDPVPPEEIRVSHSTRSISLKHANYVEHRTPMTISAIREMGLEIDDDIASDTVNLTGVEEVARNLYDEQNYLDEPSDPSMREVLFRDVTIRMDVNQDGIAELKRYYIVGSTILHDEDCENVYYAALGPIPMPHRHVGLSMADLVMDLQLIRSTLLRSYIDNLYLQNNGRFAISDRVNLDDMLVSRPGGVVRVDGEPAGAIMPLVHPSNGAAAIQGLEYIDTQKENRTGITKYNQGLDASSLNKTATGISHIMNAAQQRMELIARIFAETGVKDCFLLVHELLQKHSDKPIAMKLNNQYVNVDPRQWKTRTDMTVSVGLGTGNKDQQLQHLTTIMQVQEKGLQVGITDPKLIYNAAKRLAENAGFKDGDEFFKDPSNNPPQPPKQDPEMAKIAAQAQADAAALQAKTQADQQKLQAEMQYKTMMANQQAEFAKWKAELDGVVKVLTAQIAATKTAPDTQVDGEFQGMISQ